MSRQVEQALFSLMPTYSSDLPPSLVELAGSLLAQSRLKASTLKTEEEVARLYACANLACDRLKISLDLPPIQPRPPVPPRIYKKLYAHLDNVIPQASTPTRSKSGRTRTPRSGRASAGDAGTEQRPLPSRATPSKEQSLSQFRTRPDSASGTPTRTSARRRSIANAASLRPWVRPVAWHVCAESKQPNLAPSIVAGMEAIVVPGGSATKDGWVNENYAALFAAVFFWATARARAATKGQEVVREPSLSRRREIISALNQARRTVTVMAADEGLAWERWVDLKPRDFNEAVATVEKRGWLGDWWAGVDDVVKSADWDKAGEPSAEDADLDGPIRVRRTDTMFQDKYDYLSDARRAQYSAWRTGLLARLSPARLDNGGSAMEIDTQ